MSSRLESNDDAADNDTEVGSYVVSMSLTADDGSEVTFTDEEPLALTFAHIQVNTTKGYLLFEVNYAGTLECQLCIVCYSNEPCTGCTMMCCGRASQRETDTLI